MTEDSTWQPPSVRGDDLQRLANLEDEVMDAYKVEYAKSGRSACKGRQPCHGTLIGDGESRATAAGGRSTGGARKPKR